MRGMKWTLIIGNVAAAIGLIVLGEMGAAAHRAHAYSTYRELEFNGVLIERPDFNVQEKLAGIAAGGTYPQLVGRWGAAACIANAVAAACWPKTRSPDPGREAGDGM